MRICLVFVFLLSGCMSVPMRDYNTDFAHIMPLRKMNLQKVAVVAAPNPNADVNSVTVRGLKIEVPDSNFDDYLRGSLANELVDARLLNDKSARTISTTLLSNEVSIPAFWVGHATVEARFVVRDGKKTLYDQVKKVRRSLGWIYFGSTAFTTAMDTLPLEYHELLTALYADPEFINALKSPSGV